MAAANEWTKRGPLEWQDYTHKEVRVTASEKDYRGWVLTTDPVSAKFFFCKSSLNLLFLQSIVLVNFLEDGSMSVTGIMGHAVQTVETVNEGDQGVREKLMHLFTSGDCQAYNLEDLEKRKNSLKKWLEKNHIPVTEQGDSPGLSVWLGPPTGDPAYNPGISSESQTLILFLVLDIVQNKIQATVKYSTAF
ncbi:hypothetical protein QTO34_006670 [Cnephaeus nilssonii]|uniref:AD domain-containing protein n=1 Tax=Cnephaeus nilssonii TaxID=3371016 RepID=A0AA40LIN9_CNENI|nr:hypothetical protein QTO34_006670 [Eptesicus nilssonii]